MARRMHEPKEYYWQGKGGPNVTLGKIISELLGRDYDNYTENPIVGEPTDVYTLQFDCWNDISAHEGHSIIHVPHNEKSFIMFNMVILTDSDDATNSAININYDTTIDNSLIEDIEIWGFAVYLRKIASNQPYRTDFS